MTSTGKGEARTQCIHLVSPVETRKSKHVGRLEQNTSSAIDKWMTEDRVAAWYRVPVLNAGGSA